MRRAVATVALVLALPLVVAATDDAREDVRSCGGHHSASGADLVSVTAFADELGSVAVWRLRFAERVRLPDDDLRIDVLVRDPRLPGRRVDGQPGVNRVVRWVATDRDTPEQVRWVTEGASTPFNPAVVDGRSVELRVPGRILLGERENGTESVARARWSVVVRDGSACDRLGTAPTFRLDAAPIASGSGLPTDPVSPGGRVISAFVLLVVLVLVGVGVVALIRRSTTKS